MKQQNKLQKMKSGQFFLTIPVSICRMKGWEKGDLITIGEDGKGNLTLSK